MFGKRFICQHRCEGSSVVTAAHMEHVADSGELCQKKDRGNEVVMPLWKIKSDDAEREYRAVACNRERIRMRDMNIAYETLRKILPKSNPQGKKMSKIESLRLAIDYIHQLSAMLKESEGPTVKQEEPPLVCDAAASYFVITATSSQPQPLCHQQQFAEDGF